MVGELESLARTEQVSRVYRLIHPLRFFVTLLGFDFLGYKRRNKIISYDFV